MNRRHFLIGAGGTALVLVGAGAWVSSRDIEAARQPWDVAEKTFDDPRLHALTYAVLAPNPHNQQPWKIELVGADKIILHPDTTRFLPETDPPNRQITIGYGAFLEVLAQAASASGHRADIELFPAGVDESALDKRPIASITFAKSEAPVSDLFDSIPARRTNRQPFDTDRPITKDVMTKVIKTVGEYGNIGWTSDPAKVGRITEINKRAWAIEMGTAGPHGESTRLTRIGAAEVNAQPDGISLYGPILETAALTGAFTRENILEKDSFAFDQTAQFYSGLIDQTPTYAWLTSADNTRETQIRCGRQWVRLNQVANQMGIAFHPISQALQEFDEMVEPFGDIHEEIGVKLPARVQGLFRLGYADAPAPAPRWPLKEKLIVHG